MIHQNNSAAVYKQQLNKAFINAMNGLKFFFKNERNGMIQTSIACFVLLAGLYVHLSSTEWIIVLLCIGAVLTMEMMNSAVEQLCNLVHKEFHPSIKIIKDVAAGAVLFASFVSIIIGLIIFIPKILLLL
jgi:diacylglycerol kinase